MAEADAAAKAGGSTFGFLGHKIAGKIPVWVVAVAAVGAYYWYTRYGPGKTAAATGTTGTDPAGNTGVIDPATGFVYGSTEDQSALAAQGGTEGPAGPAGPPGPPGPPGPGPKPPKPKKKKKKVIRGRDVHVPPVRISFRPPVTRNVPSAAAPRRAATFLPAAAGSRNEEWGGNAVSNLISQGVPPDQASTAIQAHLNGQQLSPSMAASRDLAIDSVGPPPEVPPTSQAKAPMTAGSTRA